MSIEDRAKFVWLAWGIEGWLMVKEYNVRLASGLLGGTHGVLHEHGNGHGANPTGIRSYLRSDGLDIWEIDITHQARATRCGGILDPIDANVNDDGARLDHVGFDKKSFANCRDKNISPAAVSFHMASGGMANGHGRIGVLILLTKHSGHGFADDVAAS
jgi:hypothetical protein